MREAGRERNSNRREMGGEEERLERRGGGVGGGELGGNTGWSDGGRGEYGFQTAWC